MPIPITIFLGLYLIVIIFFLVFSLFTIFHAARYGVASPVNKILLILYIAVGLGILLSSLIFINQIDWSQTVDLISVL